MKLFETINNGDVYTIAEMSANHAGSIDNALQIVHAAKNAGADCLKIQTYTADTLTIPCDNKYFQIKGGLWDGYTLHDLYKQASLPWQWHKAIYDECKKVGIDFLSTPFDKSAVDFLEELGCEFYKVASFELVDIPLIEYIASKHKPMVISCGMGTIEEIHEAVHAAKKAGNNDIVLLKCCSDYPAKYDEMNISTIVDMKERFGVPVGLSDHSLGDLAAVVAASMGACVIEKHFCLDRKIKNPDSEFSMEPAEFEIMVNKLRDVKKLCGKPSYTLSASEQKSKVFRRSIFAVSDIKEGETITEDNVRIIRPGYGLKPKYYKDIIGKTAKRAIKYGEPITMTDWND